MMPYPDRYSVPCSMSNGAVFSIGLPRLYDMDMFSCAVNFNQSPEQWIFSRGSGAGNVFSDNTKFSQEHQGRRLPCKAGKRYRDLLINECGLNGIEKSRSGRTGPRTHSAAAASVNSA